MNSSFLTDHYVLINNLTLESSIPGWPDIPTIDSIIMARPTKSNVLFLQMLGRGMRLYPGKEDCLILDFVDVVKGEGLVTLPTLLGLDADSVLNSKAFMLHRHVSCTRFLTKHTNHNSCS